jgi:hypothetical protein
MKKWIVATALVVAVSAWAADRGTPAEAKAMLAQAEAHIKAVGRTQAFADFNAGKKPFKDRDLYVVCISADRYVVANGFVPQYVGRKANMLTDYNGKLIGVAILDVANTKGEGTVEYVMLDPLTHALRPKTLYVKKIGTDACGVGVYNK